MQFLPVCAAAQTADASATVYNFSTGAELYEREAKEAKEAKDKAVGKQALENQAITKKPLETKAASAAEQQALADKLNRTEKASFFRLLRLDNAASVQDLLDKGFLPNTLNPDDQTPALIFALKQESYKAAKVLIENKNTELDRLNEQGENALMYAAIKEQTSLVKLLLDRGAEPNKAGWTPLHYAASNGQTEIVKLLLDKDAYIDAEAPNGNTPLHMAAVFGNDTCVKILIDEGADASLRNLAGLTAYESALQSQRDDVMLKMLKTAAIKSAQNHEGLQLATGLNPNTLATPVADSYPSPINKRPYEDANVMTIETSPSIVIPKNLKSEKSSANVIGANSELLFNMTASPDKLGNAKETDSAKPKPLRYNAIPAPALIFK